MSAELTICELQQHEVPAVAAINAIASGYPWSEQQFVDSLNNHHCFVLKQQEKAIGFCIWQRVAGEACLLNIAIEPDFQRRGLARQLLNHGLSYCQCNGDLQCYLEVRESNLAALALYTKLGFENAGLRKNYYPLEQGREHAVIMTLDFKKITGDPQ